MLEFIEYPKCSTCQEAAELLASDGMLLKRPILVENGTVKQIGYRKSYEELGLK